MADRGPATRESGAESREAALARLYDLDLDDDPGDLDLYLALAGRTGGPIVELAVGTGRLALPLAEAGHDVIGVDDDPSMLARAEARSEVALRAARHGSHGGLRLVEHDMVDLRRGDVGLGRSAAAGAGLVILGLNSILLLADRAKQRAVFATMRELLRPDGLAAIDVWLPAVEDLARFDGRLSLEWLRTDPETRHEVTKTAAAWYDETNRTLTLTTIFEAGAPGTAPARWIRSDAMRLIGADELRAFAEEAGLVIEQLAGDHELGPFGPGSERAVLIASRPG
jgi:SAM-dependent methyltransferase